MYFEFVSRLSTPAERLSDWCRQQRVPHAIVQDTVWYNTKQLIQPFAPFYKDIQLSKTQAQSLIDELQGGVVRWSTKKQKQPAQDNDWYIINRNLQLHMEDLPESSVKRIYSGLNYCEVRPIEAELAARDGYLIQVKAQSVEKDYTSMLWFNNQEAYTAFVSRDEQFDDVIQYYGIFYENRLVGICRCLQFEQSEVQVTHTVFDPDYIKFKTKEALMWWVINYYFEERGFKSIIASTRPLDPTSTEHQFYLQNFLFEKTAMRLNVEFRGDIRNRLSLMRPFSRFVGKINSDMHTYLALDKQRSH